MDMLKTFVVRVEPFVGNDIKDVARAEETGIGDATLRYRLEREVDLLAPVRPMRKPTGKTVLEHVADQNLLPALEGPKP